MFFRLLHALSLLLITGVPITESVAVHSQPPNVTINSISAKGPGCPLDTVSATTSYDGDTITFGFDQFHPYIGPGYPAFERSKTCTIRLRLGHALGYGFELVDAVYHGSARLDVNLSATIQSSYEIIDDNLGGANAQTEVTASGELFGIYTLVGVPKDSTIVSKYGRVENELQVTTRVTLMSRSASNWGSIDDNPPFLLKVQQLHLRWLACDI
ncbi:hypothetical protein C7999DRAFT_15009 [Corynascus novoguineensis]|uniref:CUB domain-containing protein n=1 Tax=Corynascus novoguineensis TaxID=1126955 RepID=A0AAN7CRW2_9PEZI|nr:hypothetical protein C7999DRAFT_15009 [Corynascus novoguineensis]